MLCCLEETKRYKKCGSHDVQLSHSNCKRIYVFYVPQIRIERLFLQLFKKILTSLDKLPPLNYHKTLNRPAFCSFPSLKFQKKYPPTNMSCFKSWFFPHPFTKTGWQGQQTMSDYQIRLPEKNHVIYVRSQ